MTTKNTPEAILVEGLERLEKWGKAWDFRAAEDIAHEALENYRKSVIQAKPATDTGTGPLSSRLRAGVECSPWVVDEVIKLEQSTQSPRIEDRAVVDVATAIGMALQHIRICASDPIVDAELEKALAALASATPSAAVGEGFVVVEAELLNRLANDLADDHGPSVHHVSSQLSELSASAHRYSELSSEVRMALQYSRNYAKALPHPDATVMHIEGLCDLLEKLHVTPTKPGHVVAELLAADIAFDEAQAALDAFKHSKGGFAVNPVPHMHPTIVAVREASKRRREAMLNATQGGKGEG